MGIIKVYGYHVYVYIYTRKTVPTQGDVTVYNLKMSETWHNTLEGDMMRYAYFLIPVNLESRHEAWGE